jgi:beta-galactosidase
VKRFISQLGLFACVLSLFPVQHASAQDPVTVPGIFAPTGDFVAAPEKPLRDDVCLDGRWQFQPVTVPAGFEPGSGVPPPLTAPDPAKWEATPIKIPSPWNVNTWGNGRNAGAGSKRPYVTDSVYYPSYPASWDGARMGWLKRSFRVPPGWESRRIVLHFEAVAGEAQVLVNGKPAGSHFDNFMPFEMDVTGLVNRRGDNELLVGIRKSSLFNIKSPDYPPNQQRTYPNGSNMDDLVGIWNDVFLLGLPPVRVQDVFVKPLVKEGKLAVEITLRNDTGAPATVSVDARVARWINLSPKDEGEPAWKLGPQALALQEQPATVPAGGTAKLTLVTPVGNALALWSPAAPNLYGMLVRIRDGSGPNALLDQKYTRFGWREFQIAGRQLLLNGQPIRLFGDFSHPFGPYVMSRRYVAAFYSMIKDMHGNAVRPHANVMPRFWMDLADEMGLCVLDEAAVFGSSINLNLKAPVTWGRLSSHLDGLVMRDRNHPSVFAWSSANEMFALFFKTNAADKAAEYAMLQQYALRPRALDPTRPWISVDGDEDLQGVLPVWSRHMGIGLPTDLPSGDKPRMIGEHGGTYFAGPERILKDLGTDCAYASYAARNRALAFDLYRMITQCALKDLAYFSPSELVWFGLEQLPFGYRTTSRPPGLEDGIFFPQYRENVPGVQIERLPPYVMTINPGWDPALPAYRPMEMFDAMKAALDPRGPQPGPWSRLPALTQRGAAQPAQKIASVGFIGDPSGTLYKSLSSFGLPLATGTDARNTMLLVIDGEESGDARGAGNIAHAVWDRGGLVWVMARDHGSALAELSDVLPAPVLLTERKATALIKGAASPATANFGPSQLFFVAAGDSDIQKAGLAGPLVKGGKVLLEASNTDWSLFEREPEAAKCSSMLIYERLQKPPGAALVETVEGRGRLWISTLDPTLASAQARAFWTQLWENLGVQPSPLGDGKGEPGKREHNLLLDGPVN